MSVSGSSQVRLGTLRQSDLEVNVSGSGSIYADGQVTRLDARVSRSGSARLEGMRTQDGRFGVSGSGSITLAAAERADASVSGSGYYSDHRPSARSLAFGLGLWPDRGCRANL